jgi:hypothetical protein
MEFKELQEFKEAVRGSKFHRRLRRELSRTVHEDHKDQTRKNPNRR